jgi:hypothetical protein
MVARKKFIGGVTPLTNDTGCPPHMTRTRVTHHPNSGRGALWRLYNSHGLDN